MYIAIAAILWLYCLAVWCCIFRSQVQHFGKHCKTEVSAFRLNRARLWAAWSSSQPSRFDFETICWCSQWENGV